MHPYRTPCQGARSIRTAIHTTYIRTLQVHNRMLVKKASLQLWTFLFSSNTTCMLIFVGHILREFPVSENFCNYIFVRGTLYKDLRPVWVTTVAITQQPEKYYKHLPSDLSWYCHLSLPQGFSLVTNCFAIYICYNYMTAQNCFVTAYGCTTTGGAISIHMFYFFATSVPTYIHVRTDVQVYYVNIVSHIPYIQCVSTVEPVYKGHSE